MFNPTGGVACNSVMSNSTAYLLKEVAMHKNKLLYGVIVVLLGLTVVQLGFSQSYFPITRHIYCRGELIPIKDGMNIPESDLRNVIIK